MLAWATATAAAAVAAAVAVVAFLGATGATTNLSSPSSPGPSHTAPPPPTPAIPTPTTSPPVTTTVPLVTSEVLPVNECPTTNGTNQARPTRLPDRIMVALPTSQGGQLAFYSDESRSVDPVLAPKGWLCSAVIGGDQSVGVTVYPPGEADPTTVASPSPAGTEAVLAYSPSPCQICTAYLACPVFTNAGQVLDSTYPPCRVPAPAEERTFLNGSASSTGIVDITDPAGVKGLDEASGGTNPALGVLHYGSVQGEPWAAGESCVLPGGQADLCATITADFVSRSWGFLVPLSPAG